MAAAASERWTGDPEDAAEAEAEEEEEDAEPEEEDETEAATETERDAMEEVDEVDTEASDGALVTMGLERNSESPKMQGR